VKQKVSLSAGFMNRILPHARFVSTPLGHGQGADEDEYDDDGLDEVEIDASGPVTLRMWDVCEGAPESVARETWRRMLKRASSKNLRGHASSRTQQRGIDWDFLLED